MPEIRTIVVNGDSGWGFRSLLWSHGLDLFKVETGVILRDTTVPVSSEAPIIGSIGDFPEEFVADPFALAEETRQDLRWLLQDADRRLSLSVIVSLSDLERLVDAGDSWHEQNLSDDPAFSALNAFQALIDALSRQNELETDVSRAKTRLWLSLLVRDAGHRRSDGRTVRIALRRLSSRRQHIHNVFLLSNGADQNSSDEEKTAHFAKLRVLVDLLNTAGEMGGWRGLRGEMGAIEKSSINNFVMDSRPFLRSSYGCILRGGLVEHLRHGISVPVDDSNSIDAFKRDEASLINARTETAYSQERALQDLESESRGDPSRSGDADAVYQTGLDNSDVSSVLDRLRSIGRSRFSWKSDARRAIFARSSSEFEAASASTGRHFGRVIGQIAEADRKMLRRNRADLINRLSSLRLPSGEEGLRKLEAYAGELEELREETATRVEHDAKSSVRAQGALDETKEDRQAVLKMVDAAEQRMLPLKALRTPVAFLLLMCLPILTYFLIQTSDEFEGIEDIFNAAGPLFYVGVSAASCALIAGIVMGFRTTRLRNLLVKDLRKRYNRDFRQLKVMHASKLSVAHHRRRLTELTMVLHRLKPSVSLDQEERIAALAHYLEQEQANGVPIQETVDENTLVSLLEASRSNAERAVSWKDRLLRFLAKRSEAPSAKLSLTRGGDGRSDVFSITSSLMDLEASFQDPDRA